MTVSTRVCCSITSDTHTAYGSFTPRQGSRRALRSYQFRISLENLFFIVKKGASLCWTHAADASQKQSDPLELKTIPGSHDLLLIIFNQSGKFQMKIQPIAALQHLIQVLAIYR